MIALARREFHLFQAAGRDFLYLVPSAAVFALDAATAAVLRVVSDGTLSDDGVVQSLAGRFDEATVRAAIVELLEVRAIGYEHQPDEAPVRMLPMMPFPLTTMVMNVTNQCNLACTYCYEYGEDKIVDTENGQQSKFMAESTALESVEFLLKESGRVAHLTFFGGETLLNFPVLKSTIAYARRRAAELDKEIDFSLTTNATLLKPEIIEFLAENHVGVTISIDGPRDMQDKFRVFHNGAGSYDVVAPKIKELLRVHRSRPIGARVTLTSDTLDITKIYRHLTEELGFWEVGFAPVTTSPDQKYAIGDTGFDKMLGQFRALAAEFLEAVAVNKHHGFSNVKDTLEEIHKGVSKAYPCGAGLGLLGVSTDGDVALCHRFAGSDAHKFGTVKDGIDRDAQAAFLQQHHIADKTDCSKCWARPLCSGGCYHEAHVRYGTTRKPNLHYCEWIRGWTDTCLQIYGELSERNPDFLARFDREEAKAEAVL
ncbi:MAG TPA: quinohemoprotein amine dehydrogenase maturation protein [Vicinamibacterales bacterium]|nr:quinohemoprotein amine dehydrogenase maturation protein [Vicinamibacterales bacterium]